MKNATRQICINAMGVALFVALTLCVQVPVFQNYYLCLGYFVMTAFCYMIGAAEGAIVGTLGVVIYCLITGGVRGMPGWALGNLVIGIILGLTFKLVKKIRKPAVEIAISTFVATVSVAIGILVVKSGVEHVIYSLPFGLRVVTNIYAFIADVVIIVISIPICKLLEPKIKPMLLKQ